MLTGVGSQTPTDSGHPSGFDAIHPDHDAFDADQRPNLPLLEGSILASVQRDFPFSGPSRGGGSGCGVLSLSLVFDGLRSPLPRCGPSDGQELGHESPGQSFVHSSGIGLFGACCVCAGADSHRVIILAAIRTARMVGYAIDPHSA